MAARGRPSSSGYPGVSYFKHCKLWRAYVWQNKSTHQFYIGNFYTAEEAHNARVAYLKDGALPVRIGAGGPGKPRPRCTTCSKVVKWCACEAPEFEVRGVFS